MSEDFQKIEVNDAFNHPIKAGDYVSIIVGDTTFTQRMVICTVERILPNWSGKYSLNGGILVKPLKSEDKTVRGYKQVMWIDPNYVVEYLLTD